MDLLGKLGIDWKLLLAQAVNFLIVLLVLYKFLYKPIIKFLEKRRERIEASLTEAKRIEQELKELAVSKEQVLKEARLRAEEIQKQAEARAERERQETLRKVRAEAERAVAEVRQKFVVEKDQMMLQVKLQAATLVAQATTKVLAKITTPTLDKELIEQAVKEVANRQNGNKDK
ncbi:MAG: F0F1 ATP synthase subunit B [Patescibacteria group bacterium]